MTFRKTGFADVVEGLPTEGLARELMLDRFGPQCASWLVWEHRRWLHRAGQFVVVVPDVDRGGAPYQPKPWFGLAVGCLRAREGWSVDVLRHRGERRYRVRWHGWGRWSRRLPSSIARVS